MNISADLNTAKLTAVLMRLCLGPGGEQVIDGEGSELLLSLVGIGIEDCVFAGEMKEVVEQKKYKLCDDQQSKCELTR